MVTDPFSKFILGTLDHRLVPSLSRIEFKFLLGVARTPTALHLFTENPRVLLCSVLVSQVSFYYPTLSNPITASPAFFSYFLSVGQHRRKRFVLFLTEALLAVCVYFLLRSNKTRPAPYHVCSVLSDLRNLVKPSRPSHRNHKLCE